MCICSLTRCISRRADDLLTLERIDTETLAVVVACYHELVLPQIPSEACYLLLLLLEFVQCLVEFYGSGA